MKILFRLFCLTGILYGITACQSENDLMSIEQDVSTQIEVDELRPVNHQVRGEAVVADGLLSPVGVELVRPLQGLVVAEAGTGNNDGRVTLVRGRKKYVLIDNFPSNVRSDGNIEGTTHIAVCRNVLWIVNGFSGELYRFDLSRYQLGQEPIAAENLPAQDVRAFVFNAGFTDSNLYDIVADERGNLLITDSGANIVIKRRRDGQLSIFTRIPPLPNPSPIGEPTVEAVPTGIAYNGRYFSVAAFGGFPFAEGSSRIYRIGPNGNIIDFTDGYTTLIEAEGTHRARHGALYALQLGTFGETGFTPNSGALVRATPQGPEVIIEGLDFPNGLEVLRGGQQTKFFITSLTEGTLTAYLVGDQASL